MTKNCNLKYFCVNFIPRHLNLRGSLNETKYSFSDLCISCCHCRLEVPAINDT